MRLGNLVENDRIPLFALQRGTMIWGRGTGPLGAPPHVLAHPPASATPFRLLGQRPMATTGFGPAGGKESLLAHGEAVGEALGEAGVDDFVLGGVDVVLDAAEFDEVLGGGVKAVGGVPVAIARLAYAADVDEVFFVGLDPEALEWEAFDGAVIDVSARGVGVAVEAEVGVLVAEAGGGIELVEDVAPFVRGIEGGVDDGEIADLADEAEVAEPLFIFVGEIGASPVDGFLGEGVEVFLYFLGGSLLVVVAFYDRTIEAADDFDAFVGIGIVADDIAETDKMGDVVGVGVVEDGDEGLQIGVDVSKNGEQHFGRLMFWTG